MMLRVSVLICSGLLTISLSACRNQEALVRVKIVVTDDAQNVVNGAYVIIDGKAVGLTNQKGILNEEIPIKKGSALPLTIGKESPKFYYAPHEDTILVSQEGIQNIQKYAVLYSVPKPQSSVEEKAETAPVSVEPLDMTEPTSKSQVEVKKTETAAAKAEPDLLALIHSAREKSPETQPAAALKIRLLIVDSKGSPLSGAEVLVGDRRTAKIASLCRSDANGICSGNMSAVPGDEFTFIAKKDSFLTNSRSLLLQDGLNAKMTLEPGHGVDITLVSANDKTVGIPNAPVFIGEKKVGSTDQYGRFFYRFKQNKIQIKSLRVAQPENFHQTLLKLDLYEGVSQTVWKTVRTSNASREAPVLLPVTVSSDESQNKVNLDDVSRRAKIIDGWLEQFARLEKWTILQRAAATFQFDGTTLKSDQPLSSYALVAEMQLGQTEQLELRLINKDGKVFWNQLIPLGEKSTKEQVKAALQESLHYLPVYGSVRKIDNSVILADFGSNLARGINSNSKLELNSLVTDQGGASHVTTSIQLNATLRTDMLWTELDFGQLPQRTILNIGDPITYLPHVHPTVSNLFKGKPWLRVIAASPELNWHLKSSSRSIALLSDNLMSWSTLGESVSFYPVVKDLSVPELSVALRTGERLLVIAEQSDSWKPLHQALNSSKEPSFKALAPGLVPLKTEKM